MIKPGVHAALALAALALVAGCGNHQITVNGSSTSGSVAGSTSGSSGSLCATAAVCHAELDPCGGDAGACCADLTCLQGQCFPHELETCQLDGEPCQADSDCCGNPDAGTKLLCEKLGNLSVCHLGGLDEDCDSQHPCSPGLSCLTPPAGGRPSARKTPADPDAGSGSTSTSSSDSSAGSTGSIASTSGSAGSAGSAAGSSGSISTGSASAGSAGSSNGSQGSAGSSGASGSLGSTSGSNGSAGSSGTSGCVPQVPTSGAGICGVPSTCDTCNLKNPHCNPGDACAASFSGSDYCNSNSPDQLICDLGIDQCVLPAFGDNCATTCEQQGGNNFAVACGSDTNFIGGVLPYLALTNPTCLQACNTHADCPEALNIDYYDPNLPESAWCLNAGSSSVCQPAFCYFDPALQFTGVDQLESADLLYQPCPGLPNSLCVPQFFTPLSGVVGFCQMVRPDAGSTVGQACSLFASLQTPDLLCGADATCLGGVCQKICDAVGSAGEPSCAGGQTCVPVQPVNLVAGNQVGGCGTTCDALADEAHSQCSAFCGGPASRCVWYEGDNNQGYCGTEANPALSIGEPCGAYPFDPCVAGALCIGLADGGNSCARLCSTSASPAPGDGCPTGQSCQAFQGYKNAGYCQ